MSIMLQNILITLYGTKITIKILSYIEIHNNKQQYFHYYMGEEPTNKRVMYSLSVFPGKVNPSSYLYTTSIIRARLRIGASKSIETSLGLRHPSFISFHAFSIISLSSSIATFSDTP
ncbi:hypothetical protein Hanom_Chr00s000001g01596371 [Helianthus anomalus]